MTSLKKRLWQLFFRLCLFLFEYRHCEPCKYTKTSTNNHATSFSKTAQTGLKLVYCSSKLFRLQQFYLFISMGGRGGSSQNFRGTVGGQEKNSDEEGQIILYRNDHLSNPTSPPPYPIKNQQSLMSTKFNCVIRYLILTSHVKVPLKFLNLVL